jgi:hypothetical protein
MSEIKSIVILWCFLTHESDKRSCLELAPTIHYAVGVYRLYSSKGIVTAQY